MKVDGVGDEDDVHRRLLDAIDARIDPIIAELLSGARRHRAR